MICAVMALLFTLGTEMFASQIGYVPTNKRNGMMDRIRDKVEEGARDIGDALTPGTTEQGTNGTTQNGSDTTSTAVGSDTSTGAADPLTSNDPAITSPSTTMDETTTTAEDVNDAEDGKGFNWWGVLIAVAIAAAVVILIIALLPKK